MIVPDCMEKTPKTVSFPGKCQEFVAVWLETNNHSKVTSVFRKVCLSSWFLQLHTHKLQGLFKDIFKDNLQFSRSLTPFDHRIG